MNESNNKSGGVKADIIMDKRTSEAPTEPLDLSDDEAIEALFGKTTKLPKSNNHADDKEETAAADTKTKKKKKAGEIKFGEVRVREHELVLDRRSSEANGLGIGWAHRGSVHYIVDDYEQKKVDEHHNEGALKTKSKHYERFQKLVTYGYSTKEVLEAEKDRQKAQIRRQQGLPDLPSPTKTTRKNKTSRSLSPVRIFKDMASGFGAIGNNNSNDDGDDSNKDDSANRKATANSNNGGRRSRSPMRRNGRSHSPMKPNSRGRSPVRLVTGLVPGFGKKMDAAESPTTA